MSKNDNTHNASHGGSHTAIGDSIRKVGHKLDELGERTGQATDDMVHRTTRAAGHLKDEASEYSEELIQYIKKHPVKSTLIAGAAGFVLGLILKK